MRPPKSECLKCMCHQYPTTPKAILQKSIARDFDCNLNRTLQRIKKHLNRRFVFRARPNIAPVYSALAPSMAVVSAPTADQCAPTTKANFDWRDRARLHPNMGTCRCHSRDRRGLDSRPNNVLHYAAPRPNAGRDHDRRGPIASH